MHRPSQKSPSAIEAETLPERPPEAMMAALVKTLEFIFTSQMPVVRLLMAELAAPEAVRPLQAMSYVQFSGMGRAVTFQAAKLEKSLGMDKMEK